MATELITNRGTVHDSKEHLVKDLKSVVGEANEYVRENLWKIVGVAAAVGLATAFLLRHR